MVGLEGWQYYRVKDEQFGGWTDWFPAWLQNLLGNVITFNALYEKIADATEAEDEIAMLYWYGRLFNLFVDFDPIPIDDLDDDFPKFLYSLGGLAGSNVASPHRKSVLMNGEQSARRHTPVVNGWFSNTYYFLFGLVNATFGEESPNATICHTNMTLIVDASVLFYDQIAEASNVSLNASAESFETILGTVYPITFSCYQSVWEFYDTALLYASTFTSFTQISYNLVHKMGVVYDAIYYLIIHHNEKDL